jgi:two-component system response regulator RegX3
MQGNILIIEDEKELADIVALYLGKEGFEVRAVESAEQGFALMEAWKPELAILDINLPGMDGFEFLERFRREHTITVMIVSARDADEDLIAGLGGGADEFVTKPFSPRVLGARVRALFRRIRNIDGGDAGRLCRFGPFTLDYDSCVLRKGGEMVPLSAKEYGCLAFLSRNPGKPLSPKNNTRRGLEKRIWRLYHRGGPYPAAAEKNRGRPRQSGLCRNRTRHGLPF